MTSSSDRIATVPNALCVLRLAGVPLFVWLLLGPGYDMLAFVVLAASAATDWLDGKIARWFDQYSRLGELLDPAVDRLYIVAAVLAFAARDIVPWWVVAVLLGRDLVLAVFLAVNRRRGYEPPEVHYLGKAATFALLYAFPMLLLARALDGALDGPAAVLNPIGYAALGWGVALYVWSGILYLLQHMAALRRGPVGAGTAAGRPTRSVRSTW